MKMTRKHFREFESECRRLQKLWSINDWDVRVRFEPPSNRDALASAVPASTKRVVSVRLNPKCSLQFEPRPRDIARHEMVHVLLGEFSCIAGSRYVTSDEIEAAEEALVQRLLRLLP